MPKILRQGKLPEKELFEISCDNCKTLFQFERQEAKLVPDQRDGDFLEIDCPFCHKRQTVASDLNSSRRAYADLRGDH
jgi:phage FluMu protein Com